MDMLTYVDRLQAGEICIDELLNDCLLEIDIDDPDGQKTNDERFLILKETLSRIGIASYKNKTLWQTCHIFHKRGFYYLVHFKELFALDGRSSSLTIMDVQRRNLIAKILCEWGLCQPVGWEMDKLDVYDAISSIKMISFADKKNWNLQSKHPIGNR